MTTASNCRRSFVIGALLTLGWITIPAAWPPHAPPAPAVTNNDATCITAGRADHVGWLAKIRD